MRQLPFFLITTSFFTSPSGCSLTQTPASKTLSQRLSAQQELTLSIPAITDPALHITRVTISAFQTPQCKLIASQRFQVTTSDLSHPRAWRIFVPQAVPLAIAISFNDGQMNFRGNLAVGTYNQQPVIDTYLERNEPAAPALFHLLDREHHFCFEEPSVIEKGLLATHR